MNIKKIKYKVAVAVAVIATAFCGCGAGDDDIVALETLEERQSSADGYSAAPEVKASPTMPSKKSDEKIKVYVCGAVRTPDVYTVDADVRLIDAVNAAGGFSEGAAVEYLNLASGLLDGQKIYIPTNREIEEAIAAGEEIYGSEVNITSNSPGIHSGTVDTGSQGNAGAGGNDGKVNINSADRQTLMTLPGIGQSKADKIIAYRDANGGFSSIEDIMLVGGIKEGMFNKIKESICVK